MRFVSDYLKPGKFLVLVRTSRMVSMLMQNSFSQSSINAQMFVPRLSGSVTASIKAHVSSIQRIVSNSCKFWVVGLQIILFTQPFKFLISCLLHNCCINCCDDIYMISIICCFHKCFLLQERLACDSGQSYNKFAIYPNFF